VDRESGRKCTIEEAKALTCLVKGLRKIGIYEKLEEQTLNSKLNKFQDQNAWKKHTKQAKLEAKARLTQLDPTPITRAPTKGKQRKQTVPVKTEQPA